MGAFQSACGLICPAYQVCLLFLSLESHTHSGFCPYPQCVHCWEVKQEKLNQCKVSMEELLVPPTPPPRRGQRVAIRTRPMEE